MKVKNKFRVDSDKWKEWSVIAQTTFNKLYSFMLVMQESFRHPKAEPVDKKHWRTTAWNAAWIAADSVDEALGLRK